MIRGSAPTFLRSFESFEDLELARESAKTPSRIEGEHVRTDFDWENRQDLVEGLPIHPVRDVSRSEQLPGRGPKASFQLILALAYSRHIDRLAHLGSDRVKMSPWDRYDIARTIRFRHSLYCVLRTPCRASLLVGLHCLPPFLIRVANITTSSILSFSGSHTPFSACVRVTLILSYLPSFPMVTRIKLPVSWVHWQPCFYQAPWLL